MRVNRHDIFAAIVAALLFLAAGYFGAEWAVSEPSQPDLQRVATVPPTEPPAIAIPAEVRPCEDEYEDTECVYTQGDMSWWVDAEGNATIIEGGEE